MSERKSGSLIAIAAVPLIVLGTVFGIVLLGSDEGAATQCNPESGPGTSITIDPDDVPDTEIAGYSGEQLVNAAYVMQAGKDLGILNLSTTAGQTVGPLVTSALVVSTGGYGLVFPVAIVAALLGAFFITRIKSVK